MYIHNRYNMALLCIWILESRDPRVLHTLRSRDSKIHIHRSAVVCVLYTPPYAFGGSVGAYPAFIPFVIASGLLCLYRVHENHLAILIFGEVI